MPAVTTSVHLLNMTKDPGKLIESIAEISYVTQRFSEKKHPKLIQFASGRTIPFSQFKLEEDPVIGNPLPGYSKDDMYVAKIIPASHERVVKFILAIGHHSLLETCHATFLLENITRKCALHLLRYRFCVFNMQSQKYKDQGSFEYVLPSEEEATTVEKQKIINSMNNLQSIYEDLRSTGLDPEWSRCCYPNNIAQKITMTTNFRQWRHIFDCLCGDDYVSENRDVMMKCLKTLKKEAPEFFHDFIISDDGKSAKRRARKYSRNKEVNWMLTTEDKVKFGLEIPEPPKGKEIDIP